MCLCSWACCDTVSQSVKLALPVRILSAKICGHQHLRLLTCRLIARKVHLQRRMSCPEDWHWRRVEHIITTTIHICSRGRHPSHTVSAILHHVFWTISTIQSVIPSLVTFVGGECWQANCPASARSTGLIDWFQCSSQYLFSALVSPSDSWTGRQTVDEQ